MKPLNIFNIPSNDFESLLEIQNDVVYVNSQPLRASITTPQFSRKNEKYISTTTPIKRGDLVFYNNQYWLLTSQVNKRYESYKGLMTPCDHEVVFDLRQGNDSYPTKYLYKTPSYVVNTSDGKIMTGATINLELIDGEIHIRIKDTPTARLLNNQRGKSGRVLFGFVAWDIIHVSFVEKGILDITCRVSTGQDTDVYDENGAMSIVGYEDYVDDSIYLDTNSEIVPPTTINPNLPSQDLVTEVSLLKYDDTDTGTGELQWTLETKAEYGAEYASYLTGYRVQVVGYPVWGDEYDIKNDIVTDLSEYPIHAIGKYPSTTFVVRIYSIFSEGGDTVELQPIEFDKETIEALPDTWSPSAW